MPSFEDNIEAAKTNAWSWSLPAIKSAQDQVRGLRQTGGIFKAKDIYGKEQSCVVEKDREPDTESETVETIGLRFLPIQLCGVPNLPLAQSDLPGGKNCPIWVEKITRKRDCRAETHVKDMVYQLNVIGAGRHSKTFRMVFEYLDIHLSEADEITNVVCFGITDAEDTDILDHEGATEEFRFRCTTYLRYLLCSYIARALRKRLRSNTGDKERQLPMYIQGHVRCGEERKLLEIGFRPKRADADADADADETAWREQEAVLAKEYEGAICPGGYPAHVLDDAGGLVEMNKHSFIISFDGRTPVRQIAAQALADDNRPAGMLCRDIVDDGAGADCQNSTSGSHDLSSSDLQQWKAGCLEPLVLPIEEHKFNAEDWWLFRYMEVYLKKGNH